MGVQPIALKAQSLSLLSKDKIFHNGTLRKMQYD